jgi:ABC-2 type transport system permease protein
VLGKAAARAVALCGVTVVFVLIGLLLTGVNPGDSAVFAPVAILVGVVVSWALFWFAAAVAVNALGLTSANNALLLVGLWLVLVVVVPGLVQVTADVLHPPPSGIHLLHEAREATQEAEAKLMDLTGTHEKKAKPKDFAARVARVENRLAKRSVPVLEAAQARMVERQKLMASLRFLSPAMVLKWALEDLAGSGIERHHRFNEQADVFHEAYRGHFFEMIRDGQKITPQTLAALPTFTYAEEPFSQVMGRVLLAVLVLLGLACALVLGALPRFRKIGRLAN